jgi:hypothetical protein
MEQACGMRHACAVMHHCPASTVPPRGWRAAHLGHAHVLGALAREEEGGGRLVISKLCIGRVLQHPRSART